ncbi:hypothetical protein LBMAG20_18900 [Methylocystaceae bacterium]|nr:hypothetical protein LBMAG20_18900 [Methylocystaceae bacterium]
MRSPLLHFTPAVQETIKNSDCRVVITGVSGWLGQATLEMCEGVFGHHLQERVVGISSQPRELILRSGSVFKSINFDQANLLQGRPSLLAHYAFLTREKVGNQSLESYVSQNRNISQQVVSLSKKIGAIGVFSTSSGAVYDKNRILAEDIEHNPYGVLKLEEEALLQALASSEATGLSICRLFNLSGPFIHKDFALNSIIKSLFEKKEIHLKANRKVVRDYIHVEDLVSLGFSMMLDAKNQYKTPYDTGVGEEIEVGDLAKRVRSLLGQPDALIFRPQIINEEDIYIGNTQIIKNLFQSYRLAPKCLDEQILTTAAYIHELFSGENI